MSWRSYEGAVGTLGRVQGRSSPSPSPNQSTSKVAPDLRVKSILKIDSIDEENVIDLRDLGDDNEK